MSKPSAQPLHFQRHIFFCTNQRTDGRRSCGDFDSTASMLYCKQKLREAGLLGAGQVRVNRAGCLGRCLSGPVAVVYPEGVWYNWVDLSDLDEIVESHLKNGRIVERLLVAPEPATCTDAADLGPVTQSDTIEHGTTT